MTDAYSEMIDPFNPTKEQLYKWAYEEMAQYGQDWDIIIAGIGPTKHTEDILEYAADKNCPSRLFFLKVLYITIGDSFRDAQKKGGEDTHKRIMKLLEKAATVPDPSIQHWYKQALAVMTGDMKFYRPEWLDGSLMQ